MRKTEFEVGGGNIINRRFIAIWVRLYHLVLLLLRGHALLACRAAWADSLKVRAPGVWRPVTFPGAVLSLVSEALQLSPSECDVDVSSLDESELPREQPPASLQLFCCSSLLRRYLYGGR